MNWLKIRQRPILSLQQPLSSTANSPGTMKLSMSRAKLTKTSTRAFSEIGSRLWDSLLGIRVTRNLIIFRMKCTIHFNFEFDNCSYKQQTRGEVEEKDEDEKDKKQCKRKDKKKEKNTTKKAHSPDCSRESDWKSKSSAYWDFILSWECQY